MTDTVIDYKFTQLDVTNPDGSLPMKVANGIVANGPGGTVAGTFPKAVDLGTTGRGAVSLNGVALNLQRFTIRIVFSARGPVTRRQNLAESNFLPFSLFLTGRAGSPTFDLVGSVAPKAHGWRAATTRFATGLKAGAWYVADLVYDVDTVGVFIDGQIVSVHAFPQGTIQKFAGRKVFVGTWVDGARDHFDGQLAALTLYNGVPDALEAQLDERRSHPEWFVTHKLEALRSFKDLGEPTSAIAWDPTTGAYLQEYQHGALMYHDRVGAAFAMHGAIHAGYKALRSRAALGHLVSDEVPATKRGGRKSIFSKGAIYWSAGTGAIPVLDQIYLAYEGLRESAFLGFPTKSYDRIVGGKEQEFQRGRIYHQAGAPRAYEVHGGILNKYRALGGPRNWGFPITNESEIKRGSTVIGKFSDFERSTIYWRSGTGAFEVHGDIKRKYTDLGGPAGELGFPTSDETAMTGLAGGGRFNTFEKGTLLRHGSSASITVARPFRIHLGRIDSREHEGYGMGQNDMYIHIKVKNGNATLFDRRRPSRGQWSGKNIIDVNYTIPVTLVPDPKKTITFSVDVREADPGNDDHLGKWTKVLNASNGWGMSENGGIFHSGSFSHIRSIAASVKPVVDIRSLSEPEKFWGVRNQPTDDLTYRQYASAFSDVDSQTEWWDVTDWLDKAFYELVVQDIAEGGNCFGMSLEAIYAKKGSSLFSLPLNRFTSWNAIRTEVNIKHSYQVGANPIWWFLGEFLTGNTHDPVDVFRRSREAFMRGSDPVLCLAQNYDFSGKPHAVLPVAWDDAVRPWRMTICDPNFPNQTKVLTIDPGKNSFEYVGGSTYRGDEWSGGRLHYIPFSVLCSRQRTPIWDAILLLLNGTLILLGEDIRTTSITDPSGLDLDGHGNRATEELKAGRPLTDFFASFKGYGRTGGRGGTRPAAPGVAGLPGAGPRGTVKGELLARMLLPSLEVAEGSAGVDPSVLSHLPLRALTLTRDMRRVREAIEGGSALAPHLIDRTIHHVASDPVVLNALRPAARKAVLGAADAARQGDFRHKTSGVRGGSFRYAAKQGLTEFRIESAIASGEVTDVDVDHLGASTGTVRVKPDRDKQARIEVSNKLGVAGDRVRVRIDNLPMERAKDFRMNLKPGLAGLDLISLTGLANLPVEVEASIGGKTISRHFTLPLDQGARLKLSTVLSQGTLGVSRIDQLFGPARDVRLVQASD